MSPQIRARSDISPVVYCIHTSRLILRCWTPTDAPALVEAIAASLDHLRVWMPWANAEPRGVDVKMDEIRKWRSQFDLGQSYTFGIFDPQQSQVVGGIGMHARIGAGAREIGYWIRADRTRQGLATEAAGALTRIGFELLKLRRMEIHCDPKNIASAGVPRKLGYAHELIIRRCVPHAAAPQRDSSIWALTRAMYPASGAAFSQLEAFDAAGRPVLFPTQMLSA